MLHRQATGARRGEELARVVPGEGLDGTASLEGLDGCCGSLLTEVEDGDAGLALGGGGEPESVLGECEGLYGRAEAEGGGLLEGLGHVEFDVALGGAGGEEVAVGVEDGGG